MDIIGKACFIKHRNGTESYAGIAIRLAGYEGTLVEFTEKKLLWPVDQVIPIAEAKRSSLDELI